MDPPPSLAVRVAKGAAFAMAIALLFAPLYLVSRLDADAAMRAQQGAAAATVGLGVIFRSVARNLLRTSVGIVSRTASRAASRRWTRALIKSASSFVKLASRDAKDADEAPQSPIAALAFGFVALAASYAGVLWLQEESLRAQILASKPLWMAAAAGAVPLLVYYGVARTAAAVLKMTVTPRTGLDGLLLQAYFTFSGSFLPLTTDVAYEGDKRQNAIAAAVTLGSLLALHWTLFLAAEAVGSTELVHASSLFLVYAFVLAFPFRPLDGFHIWSRNKLWWVLFSLPFGLSFHFNLPRSFHAVM